MAILYVTETGNFFGVLDDAEAAVDRVLAAHRDNALAHFVKALVLEGRGQFDNELAQLNMAIASDPNLAGAYAEKGNASILLGRAADAFEPLEQAFRLDPRERGRNVREYYTCLAHAHLAHWEAATEWCEKSIATDPSFPYPYANLAAAYGWLGRMIERNKTWDQLLKLKPGSTIQQWLQGMPSLNPVWGSEAARIEEGITK